MKNVFLFILTITTLKIVGQNHFVGIKGGANKTNISSSNFTNQHNSRTGLSAGLSYEFLFKKRFSVGADLMYSQRGFTDYIVFTDDFGNPTGEKYAIKLNYNYISLPIKTGFNIGNKVYGFANIGVIPSFLVNAKTIVPTFDIEKKLTGNEVFDVTNQVAKFDFAGLAEIGGGYKFKNRYWLFSSFSYQHSFTTITNSNYFPNSKIRHYGMTLNLGLKYALKKG